jgi:hypothetical protein
MTKRAKLSLDPSKRDRRRPPHGFDEGLEPATGVEQMGDGPRATDAVSPAQSTASSAELPPERTKPKAAGAPWQADRPRPEPTAGPQDPSRAPLADSGPGREADAAAAPARAVALLKALAHNPTVRIAVVSIAAGLSLYLLRRRLF